MANTIKIKRSQVTATPVSLAEGELAYSENSGTLFIGTSGANVTAIGGTNATHQAVTINATANGLSVDGSQVLTLGLASTSTIGALSDTDWNTFNNKTSNTGTVTSITAGNGLDFTTITTSGAVTLGTPGDLTDSTTSAVTATSHTHAVSGFILSSWVDTDTTLSANSDSKIATQKAVKAYADALIGAANATVYKGVIDCAANPNYPAADAGDLYRISVAGKIGGASGINVEVGDMIICLTDSTASGDHATVGSNWNIIQANIDGAVIGPASAVDGNVAFFDGTSGNLIKDSSITLSGSNTGDVTLANTNYLTISSQEITGGTIPVASGGTNITSYAIGDIIYASGTTVLSALAGVATGNVLISGGVATAPSWGQVSLTTHVTGILPVANGGTGATTFTANGILYGNTTSAIAVTAAGTDGYFLYSNSGTPDWTNTVDGGTF